MPKKVKMIKPINGNKSISKKRMTKNVMLKFVQFNNCLVGTRLHLAITELKVLSQFINRWKNLIIFFCLSVLRSRQKHSLQNQSCNLKALVIPS